MKLTLGFSPCPNDTFMFDALVHNKIDTEGLEFEVVLSDVEQLNQWALKSKLDLTKLSFNAFRYCVNDYSLLDSGSALGRNCGPLLIKNPQTELTKESLIAIPGKYTTANLLLDLAFPNFQNKQEVLFSEIEEKVLKNEVDAGLIIHENRFTYQNRGLEKVIDLGEFWEQKTSLPIPLGGIFIKGNFTKDIKKKVERVLKRSVEFAFSNPRRAKRSPLHQYPQPLDVASSMAIITSGLYGHFASIVAPGLAIAAFSLAINSILSPNISVCSNEISVKIVKSA